MSQGAEVILEIGEDVDLIPIDQSGVYLPVEESYKVYQRPLLFDEKLRQGYTTEVARFLS